jgi:hypothetical protein
MHFSSTAELVIPVWALVQLFPPRMVQESWITEWTQSCHQLWLAWCQDQESIVSLILIMTTMLFSGHAPVSHSCIQVKSFHVLFCKIKVHLPTLHLEYRLISLSMSQKIWLLHDFRRLCPDTIPSWSAVCNHDINSRVFYIFCNIWSLMKQFILCPVGIHTPFLSLHVQKTNETMCIQA